MHVQFVLVMYTPSFRPFVSEIDIRWSAGRPTASRLYDALLAESRHAGSVILAAMEWLALFATGGELHLTLEP